MPAQDNVEDVIKARDLVISYLKLSNTDQMHIAEQLGFEVKWNDDHGGWHPQVLEFLAWVRESNLIINFRDLVKEQWLGRE